MASHPLEKKNLLEDLLTLTDPGVAIYEDVVRQLDDLILNDKLRSGEKLPSERALAQAMGVSRNAVREGIKVLEERGLLVVRPGKGIFLTAPPADSLSGALELQMKFRRGTIDHLLEARECLELTIARLAAERANEEHLAQLAAHLNTMEQTLNQPHGFIEADREFHAALARAAQNPMLEAFAASTIRLMDQTRHHMILAVVNGTGRAQFHHRAIYQALTAHHPEAAIWAMQGHFVQIREDVDQTRHHLEQMPRRRGATSLL